jgi:hypothetical protein
MKYKVYYEIGGHKMKSDVNARGENDARNKILDKLFFHRIEPMEPTTTDSDIFSFLKGFKK